MLSPLQHAQYRYATSSIEIGPAPTTSTILNNDVGIKRATYVILCLQICSPVQQQLCALTMTMPHSYMECCPSALFGGGTHASHTSLTFSHKPPNTHVQLKLRNSEICHITLHSHAATHKTSISKLCNISHLLTKVFHTLLLWTPNLITADSLTQIN